MAAELKGKQAAARKTRKILVRQIDKAGAPLQGKTPSDSRIHRARKEIKMARATLRLLRESLPRKRYRAENERLRDAAKPLSAARDATVLLTAFDALVKTHSRQRDGTEAFRDELTRERVKTRRALTSQHGLTRSCRLLRRARAHAARWQVSGKGWSVIGAGLEKVYAQGRDALAAARKRPTDSAFHEWRKQAKYLRHQLQLLQNVRPAALGALVDDLHKLTDQLGDDHDLAVLRMKMAARPPQRVNPAAHQELGARIQRRRVALQLQAVRVGSRVYHETPRQFCSRMRSWWRAWHPCP